MKKSSQLFFLLLFFLLTTIVSAQPYIGVFGGLNRSKLSGDIPDKASFKSLTGANVGAYLDIKITKIIWFSLQPSYTQEGTKITYRVSGKEKPVDSINVRLNYFSLPVLLKVTSTNERFYAICGFEAGYLLDSYISSHDIQNDIKANVAEWNLAMHFGAGIKIPIGLPRLFIELRYTQGLLNLTDEPIEESYIPRVKTNGFKLLAGIEIPLKKIDK